MYDELIKGYKNKIPEPLLNNFKKLAKEMKLSDKDAKKVLAKLEEKYLESKIDAGEAIGVVTAESFGEPSTQMTLRTFHFAGVAEANITLGLPRLIEIFDARKTISTPVMEVHLKEPYNKEEKNLEKIIAKIKEIKLLEIISEIAINILKLQIEINLDKKRMKTLEIEEADVIKALKSSFKTHSISVEGGEVIFKPNAKEVTLPLVYTLKEKVKNVIIKGTPDIKEVIPVQKNGEIVLLTTGSNLKKVIELPEVDASKTFSNDIFEVAKVFGIEAARQAIINEALKVIQDQALDIDIRHIMFVSDLMTTTGTIKGITRSGITGEKESVLARASFETPIIHLINASLTGEIDHLNSVVENVIINQPIPLGTGLPDLVAKMGSSEDDK